MSKDRSRQEISNKMTKDVTPLAADESLCYQNNLCLIYVLSATNVPLCQMFTLFH